MRATLASKFDVQRTPLPLFNPESTCAKCGRGGPGMTHPSDECACGHPFYWHDATGSRCDFHCGNPERCRCAGFAPSSFSTRKDLQ